MSGSERFQPQHLTVLIALVEGSELLNEGKGAVAFKPLVSVVTKKKSQMGIQDSFSAQGGRVRLLTHKQLENIKQVSSTHAGLRSTDCHRNSDWAIGR